VIGAGVQAFYQVMACATVRKLTDLSVLSTNSRTGAAFAQKVKEHLPGLNAYVAKSAEDLLENSEIVITATTASTPVLPDDETVLKGKHYVGIGSFQPDAREFPAALYRLIEKIYVDTWHAVKESGDVCYPLQQKWLTDEQVQTLGRYIMQSRETTQKQGTTFFKSVGMALFDLAAARVVYERAVEKGLGTKFIL